MMGLIEKIVAPENLHWAWEKAVNIYGLNDAWFDELEVARFEANLDRELRSIAHGFENADYSITPLRPLPQPKKRTVPDEKPVRQTFWIAVRDQVAWIAFVNVLGPELDQQMPPWSYAYRLYRPVWYEDEEVRRQFRKGPYRHTAGRLYRQFRQSWPLYRRHISLTLRAAGRISGRPTDEAEAHILEAEKQLADSEKLPYLLPGWWTKRATSLYRGHVDLRKFYPSIRLKGVRANFLKYCSEDRETLRSLLGPLLHFPVDTAGYTVDHLADLGLLVPETGRPIDRFTGLPTGLFTAGFLSNVALLEVDQEINSRLHEHQVAHFRYVDDHTFLASTTDALVNWVTTYRGLLLEKEVGVDFHPEKIEPASVKAFVNEYILSPPDHKTGRNTAARRRALRELKKDACVDPKFPAPLLTATLAKISGIAHAPFLILDRHGQENLIQELQFLLAAQLPDDEIRDDTRVSFAMSRLARMAPKQISWTDPHIQRRESLPLIEVFLRSIRGYPEKLRLWGHFLEYCRRTGIRGFPALWKEASRLVTRYEPSGAYLRAYLKTFLAGQVMKCVYEIRDQNGLPSRRLDSARYLQHVLSIPDAPSDESSWWFEARSDEVLKAARLAARFLVRKLLKGKNQPRKLVLGIKGMAYSESSKKWAQEVRMQSGSMEALALWTYWIEKRTQSPMSTSPGPVWESLASTLQPTANTTRAVWSRYPAHLPKKAVGWGFGPTAEWPHNDQGWLWDVVSGLEERQELTGLSAETEESIAGLKGLGQLSDEWLTLDAWAKWCRDFHSHSPHDPRIGEWTALELVIRIARVVGEKSEWDGTFLHPANFFLPRQWIVEPSHPWSWESWRRQMNHPAGCPQLRSESPIQDFRHITTSGVGDEQHRQWSLIQGLGVLLLGLSSRSFRSPAAWNQPGYALASAFPAKPLIHRLQLSSWTTALLEACLLPRVKETMLFFESLFVNADKDTTSDPPLVWDTADFVKYALHAQSVLQEYQLMVHGSMPRQLVPRRLDQIKSDEWEAPETDAPF
ncbi:MAG: RNA-directed DNA polymerase [Pirellulaceae bacterium]